MIFKWSQLLLINMLVWINDIHDCSFNKVHWAKNKNILLSSFTLQIIVWGKAGLGYVVVHFLSLPLLMTPPSGKQAALLCTKKSNFSYKAPNCPFLKKNIIWLMENVTLLLNLTAVRNLWKPCLQKEIKHFMLPARFINSPSSMYYRTIAGNPNKQQMHRNKLMPIFWYYFQSFSAIKKNQVHKIDNKTFHKN